MALLWARGRRWARPPHGITSESLTMKTGEVAPRALGSAQVAGPGWDPILMQIVS